VSRASEVGGRLPRRWYLVGVAGVVAVGLLTFGLARWIEGRLNDAAARVAAAERQVVATTQLANREVVAAREGADRQIAEARQLAQRAETVGAILTAPDLIRFNLTSAGADRSSAQVLWSRTRGLVLSGSRLPAAPPESTYQLWLVTGTQSVSAGLFVPDAAGRATLVIEVPPRVAGPVVGAAVTVEPDGGRPAPSGRTLLARFP
jgi:Anti-sigma-K factor rskA